MKKLGVAYTRILLIFVAVILIIVGVLSGEHLSVLQKSIRICLECIGIG